MLKLKFNNYRTIDQNRISIVRFVVSTLVKMGTMYYQMTKMYPQGSNGHHGDGDGAYE